MDEPSTTGTPGQGTATPVVVVIGASAGGVQALKTLVGGLPAGFPAAVCIVTHISAHTPSQMAAILQQVSRLPVLDVSDGARLEAGHVYTAVADRHTMIVGGALRLTRGPKECRSRPAIDVLFRSAAAALGPRVVGVILTGMLDDGTAGLWAIKEAGGRALVQAPETAEYDSMPESARAHVNVDASLPVEELADEIGRQIESIGAGNDRKPVSTATATELTIASEGNGLKAGVMRLGEISEYTCPDCHGVLVRIVDGEVLRFRCHTGHAFSMKTLLAEVDEAIDDGLWATLRAIEERALLLRQMAHLAKGRGDEAAVQACEARAVDAETRSESIRTLVLDPDLFGHTPKTSD